MSPTSSQRPSVVPRIRSCHAHASPPSEVIEIGRVRDVCVDGEGDGDEEAGAWTVADAAATRASGGGRLDPHAVATAASPTAATISGRCPRARITFAHHPFTPVSAIPRTKYRWNTRNSTSRGSVASTEPAITCVHKTCRPWTKNVRPSGSVYSCWLLSIING